MNLSIKKRLRQARHDIELPFSLWLTDSDDVLHCTKLLRLVPGTRATLLGNWGSKRVVAKLFYRTLQIHRHLRREAEGIRALSSVGIPTADLLYVGNARNTPVGVLLFEYIEQVNDLGKVWNVIDSVSERRCLLSRAIAVIAKMHQAGLKQQDLHFDNFLITSRAVYIADGSSIRQQTGDHPLKVRESLNNLALFFAQMTLRDDSLVQDLYADYSIARGWTSTNDMFPRFQLEIDRRRKRRMTKYLKKIFRESTEIVCRKSLTRFMLCKRSYYTRTMVAFLKDPDRLLEKEETTLLKNGNTSTVARLKIDNQDLVVKRYNIKNFGHGLRRSFMSTRAAHAWRNTHLLLLLGIQTPPPVALLEQRRGPFRSKAYFVSEYLDGPHALDFFMRANLQEKSAVAHRIADMLKNLKLARISHGDLKATNIIIRNKEPALIDLERICTHHSRRRFLSAHHKDIKRFFQNWKNLPEVSRMFEEVVNQTIR